MTFGFISGPGPWLALCAVTVVLLTVDLKLFARGREPTFRRGGMDGRLARAGVAGFGAARVGCCRDAEGRRSTYTTVYFIERSLSLDNLFVFLLLFSYFGVPEEHRPNLLFWGIVAALALRGLAILGGVALIEQFHFVIYILGVLLLVLAYRILRGVEENVDPDKNLIVRGVRKLFPVSSDFHGHHWFTHIDGKRYATPIFVCLAAIVADIAFAIDSIPAAFAITRDSVLIWMANIFALLGLRALFVLVEGLIRRFRYLDETIALVLALHPLRVIADGDRRDDPLVRVGDDRHLVVAAGRDEVQLPVGAVRRPVRLAPGVEAPSPRSRRARRSPRSRTSCPPRRASCRRGSSRCRGGRSRARSSRAAAPGPARRWAGGRSAPACRSARSNSTKPCRKESCR